LSHDSPARCPDGRDHGPFADRRAGRDAATAQPLATDVATALDGLETIADDSRVIVVGAGGLAAVFLGGALIGSLLQPFAERVTDREPAISGLQNAGRVIGWIERTLLYALVLTGAPDAAAIVIAAKSIARFPSFQREAFAEYYLIGSLLSLSVAFGTALAVGAITGIDQGW
jgi:hypothetical protein